MFHVEHQEFISGSMFHVEQMLSILITDGLFSHLY